MAQTRSVGRPGSHLHLKKLVLSFFGGKEWGRGEEETGVAVVVVESRGKRCWRNQGNVCETLLNAQLTAHAPMHFCKNQLIFSRPSSITFKSEDVYNNDPGQAYKSMTLFQMYLHCMNIYSNKYPQFIGRWHWSLSPGRRGGSWHATSPGGTGLNWSV